MIAHALKSKGKIVALSRYYEIPDSQGLADIPIVVSEKFRGKGPSAALVSRLVKDILDDGLIPRYRANYELKANITRRHLNIASSD